MTLTGKQKRNLRSRGQNLEAVMAVGKQGVTDNVLKTVRELMQSRDLIKVKILAEESSERETIANALASSLGADLAGLVGKTALLHRPVPAAPPKPGRR